MIVSYIRLKLIGTLMWGLAAAPASVMAQDITAAELTDLPRADFLEEAERIHESAWPDLSLMFTRVDGSFQEKLPPYDHWDDQMRHLTACVYDRMAEKSTLDKFADYVVLQTEFAAYLVENPNLDVISLQEDPITQERYAEPATEYLQASSACGLLDYQAQLMQESGLVEALLQFYQ